MLNLHQELKTRAGLLGLSTIDVLKPETQDWDPPSSVQSLDECLAELEADVEACEVLVTARKAFRYHQ